MTDARAAKQVYIFPAAERDITEVSEYYRQNAGSTFALKWVAEIEEAFRAISSFPDSGSLRYAELLSLENLRFKVLNSFPYLVFFVMKTDKIEIWRVLHGQQDIPDWLRSK